MVQLNLLKTQLRNLVCASLLVLPPMAFGRNAAVSIGSAWAKPGWTVDLPITLSEGAQPTALQWSFTYSSDIKSVKVVAGVSTKTAGKTLSCTATKCLVFGGEKTALADGVVAVATFQLAAKPSSTTIEIVVKEVVAAEMSGNPIPASGGTGKITLLAPAAFSRPPGSFLKVFPQQADRLSMERRLHPRTEVQFEAKVTNLKTLQQSCLGLVCNISEKGISVLQPLQIAVDDLVQLEMADSVAVGRVIYSKPEGVQFRIGIEMQKIEIGNSDLSSLLRRTLIETMPGIPGVEYAETHFG